MGWAVVARGSGVEELALAGAAAGLGSLAAVPLEALAAAALVAWALPAPALVLMRVVPMRVAVLMDLSYQRVEPVNDEC